MPLVDGFNWSCRECHRGPKKARCEHASGLPLFHIRSNPRGIKPTCYEDPPPLEGSIYVVTKQQFMQERDRIKEELRREIGTESAANSAEKRVQKLLAAEDDEAAEEVWEAYSALCKAEEMPLFPMTNGKCVLLMLQWEREGMDLPKADESTRMLDTLRDISWEKQRPRKPDQGRSLLKQPLVCDVLHMWTIQSPAVTAEIEAAMALHTQRDAVLLPTSTTRHFLEQRTLMLFYLRSEEEDSSYADFCCSRVHYWRRAIRHKPVLAECDRALLDYEAAARHYGFHPYPVTPIRAAFMLYDLLASGRPAEIVMSRRSHLEQLITLCGRVAFDNAQVPDASALLADMTVLQESDIRKMLERMARPTQTRVSAPGHYEENSEGVVQLVRKGVVLEHVRADEVSLGNQRQTPGSQTAESEGVDPGSGASAADAGVNEQDVQSTQRGDDKDDHELAAKSKTKQKIVTEGPTAPREVMAAFTLSHPVSAPTDSLSEYMAPVALISLPKYERKALDQHLFIESRGFTKAVGSEDSPMWLRKEQIGGVELSVAPSEAAVLAMLRAEEQTPSVQVSEASEEASAIALLAMRREA